MTCTPAQLEANRRNSARSTGPRTPEGKAISRRNGLKHGLTGQGIALPHEDAEEIQDRIEALEAEMRPNSELARQLLSRYALMTIRLRRSAEHEAKALSYTIRHAAEKFDEARLAEVDHLMSWIASEPATNVRRLRRMPEGIERLIAAITGLRADLARAGGYRWGYDHSEQLHHLLGLRSVDLPVSRVRALTEAILGNFRHLADTEGPGLKDEDRRIWAIGELVYFMDAEIERLKAMLEAIDREGLDLDRSEAATRAIFDDSKEAILARKYEAASERSMYRALREFHEVQAESVGEPPVMAELASSLPEPVEVPDESVDTDPIPVEAVVTVPVRHGSTEKPSRPRLDGRSRKGRRAKTR
jgi:hypothetical protein